MKSVLVLFLCISAVISASKRSPRWDAHQEHLRSKRQARPAGCNWQVKGTPCNLNTMENDALGRRASGLLSPVEDQGTCGSCWAFAATHTFADARSIQAGSLTPPLSPQYLASCITTYEYSCCGGFHSDGLAWFRDTGAVTKTCAPYILDDYVYYSFYRFFNRPTRHYCPLTCTDNSPINPSAIRLNNFQQIQESEVIAALNTAPVAVGIQVSEAFLHSYSGCGIFCHEPGDPFLNMLHAVEIVDYGTENGIDFWVIKNSWGEDFGEHGYFRMRRGDLNIQELFTPTSSSSVQPNPPSVIEFRTCSPVEVASPNADELVMSAVDHTVNEINQNNSIPCPDGSQPSEVVFRSAMNATTQIVDGTLVITEIIVDLQGCGSNVRATVNSTVLLQDDNTFDLIEYMYDYSGGNALAGSVAMVMAVVVVTLPLMW